jgi:hypothetical protein
MFEIIGRSASFLVRLEMPEASLANLPVTAQQYDQRRVRILKQDIVIAISTRYESVINI